MSTATELLETSEQPAVQKVYAFIDGSGEEPSPREWLQMLAHTTGIVLRVSQYYLSYDGAVNVTVHSKGFTDHHAAESQYVESLLDYYNPQPVYVKNSPIWVQRNE